MSNWDVMMNTPFDELKEKYLEGIREAAFDPNKMPNVDLNDEDSVMSAIMSTSGPGILGGLSMMHNNVSDKVINKYKEVMAEITQFIEDLKSCGDHKKDAMRLDYLAQRVHQMSLIFHLNNEEDMLERLDMQRDPQTSIDMADDTVETYYK